MPGLISLPITGQKKTWQQKRKKKPAGKAK